jgi:cytochrome b pre-mRNA-processing protein 3
MMLDKLFRRRRVERAAEALYATLVAQARRPEFYRTYAVPDTVDGRFDMVALHGFLLLHRLGQGRRRTSRVAQALFDLMFADMDQCLREMGVSDIAVGGKVKTMAQAFYGRIDAYEPGLTDVQALIAALARNLYRGTLVAQDTLVAMARYTQLQATSLAAQEIVELEQGRVRFDDPVYP